MCSNFARRSTLEASLGPVVVGLTLRLVKVWDFSGGHGEKWVIGKLKLTFLCGSP